MIDVPRKDPNTCNRARVWRVHFLPLRTLSHSYDYSLCSYLLPVIVLIFLCRSLHVSVSSVHSVVMEWMEVVGSALLIIVTGV